MTPFYFVSAADGTNVVKVNHSCTAQGHGDCYKHGVGNGVVPLFGTWVVPLTVSSYRVEGFSLWGVGTISIY